MTEKSLEKFGFWQSSKVEKKQYFVVKETKEGRALTGKELVKEHIANNLYRLFGLRTPDARILVDLGNHTLPTRYSFASEYIAGYRDLIDVIGGEKTLTTLNNLTSVEDRTVALSAKIRFVCDRLMDRAQLLVAAVCFIDFDVLGNGLSNVGVLPIGKRTLKLVNIDPGEVDFSTTIDDFKQKVSLNNALLNEDFKANFINSPKSISGDLHFSEFFINTPRKELLQALENLNAISDEEIYKHVMRDDYLNLVDKDYLEMIARNIRDRKNYLSSFARCKFTHERTVALKPIFSNRNEYSEGIHQILKGNAKPVVVEKFKQTEQDYPAISMARAISP